MLDQGEEPRPYRISQMTKIPVSRVKDSLKRIQTYPRIIWFVKEVKKIGWYRKVRMPGIQQMMSDMLQRAHEDGYYIGAKAPVGYVKTSTNMISGLEPHSDLFPKVRDAIEGFYVHNKTIRQIHTETGLARSRLHAILFRNIRFYAGFVKYKKDWKPGRHKVSVSEKVWESVIKPTLEAPRQLYGKIPRAHAVGTIYTKGLWMWDPPRIQRVQNAYRLRLKGVGLNEIGRETDLYPSTLAEIFRNPLYANKIRVAGKPPQEWPDAGIVYPDGGKEPPISLDDWLKVQEFRDTRPIWVASKEARQKKLQNRKNDVYVFIVQNEPTRAQIIKHFCGIYSAHEIDNSLRLLRNQEQIHKRGGWKSGKFYPTVQKKT